MELSSATRLKFSYLYTNPVLQKSFGMFDTFLREYFKISSGQLDSNRLNFEQSYTNLLEKCKDQTTEFMQELLRIKTLIAGFIGIELPDSLYDLIAPENLSEALQSAFLIFLQAQIYSVSQIS